jgi:hypothetical protein
MDTYGGYPDRWLEQDWDVCENLLSVNSILQKVKARENKKKGMKSKKPRN